MAAGDSDGGLRCQGYWVFQANLGTNTLAVCRSPGLMTLLASGLLGLGMKRARRRTPGARRTA
jgi:hypothetical protein